MPRSKSRSNCSSFCPSLTGREGRDLDRGSHARRLPLPDRKDPYISERTPACSSRGPPTSPTRIRHPCALPLLALAARAALPCALPAATAACTPDSAWDPPQPGCPLPSLARPFPFFTVTARQPDCGTARSMPFEFISLDPLACRRKCLPGAPSDPAVRHSDVLNRAQKKRALIRHCRIHPTPEDASSRDRVLGQTQKGIACPPM